MSRYKKNPTTIVVSHMVTRYSSCLMDVRCLVTVLLSFKRGFSVGDILKSESLELSSQSGAAQILLNRAKKLVGTVFAFCVLTSLIGSNQQVSAQEIKPRADSDLAACDDLSIDRVWLPSSLPKLEILEESLRRTPPDESTRNFALLTAYNSSTISSQLKYLKQRPLLHELRSFKLLNIKSRTEEIVRPLKLIRGGRALNELSEENRDKELLAQVRFVKQIQKKLFDWWQREVDGKRVPVFDIEIDNGGKIQRVACRDSRFASLPVVIASAEALCRMQFDQLPEKLRTSNREPLCVRIAMNGTLRPNVNNSVLRPYPFQSQHPFLLKLIQAVKECCSSLELGESATAVQFNIMKDGTITEVSVDGTDSSDQRSLVAGRIERLKVDNPKSTCLEELSQESMRVRLNLATGKLIDIYDDWHSAAHLRQYEWNEFRTYNPQLGGI